MDQSEDDSGDVYTWGSAEMGQLGCPPRQVLSLRKDAEGFPFESTPIQLLSLSSQRVVQVAGGDGHSLAVTASGKVFAWGASACGQLGLRRIDSMPKDSEGYPYHPEPKLIEGLLRFKVTMVACGDAHTAALTMQGQVLTWGGGGCGQLGHADTDFMPKDDDGCPYQPEPRIVDSLNAPIRFICCGKAHTVAIALDGLTHTWGAGACGQLGHADMTSFPIDEDGYPFHPVPKLISSLKKQRMSSAACGDVHTLLLSEEGTVFCFGGGSFGQLGLGSIVHLPVDVDDCPYMPIPKPIESLPKVTQIACGDSHSMALTSKGKVFGWGAAACGQLGLEHLDHLPKDPDDKPYQPEPAPIPELSSKAVRAIACGEAHTLVLTSSGLLYSFGANNCGQLGIERGSTFQKKPVLVSSLLGKRVLSVSTGGVHNIIVTQSHSRSLANSLYECYVQGLLTDMSFRVDSQIVSCHRVVLAARSAYFRRMVVGQEPIDVDFSLSTFSRLIEYLYKDDIEILLDTLSVCSSVNQIVDLLRLANVFQLKELKESCELLFAEKVGHIIPLAAAPNLVFLPDGRAAILSPQSYRAMMEDAIIVDTNGKRTDLQQAASHGSLSSDLLRQLNRPQLSDVTIVVQGQTFNAHKVILAARSQYFSALYSHGFREAKEGVVKIGDVTVQAMSVLLRHIYSDEIQVQMDSVMELLALSERFSVASAKQKCEAALAPTLSVQNAAQLYRYSKLFNCHNLREICLSYISTVYAELIVSKGMEELDKESILEIMRFNTIFR